MKGFVEATQEADPYLIRPSLKNIGGRTCRRIGLNYPVADHVRRGNCATTYTDS